MRSAPATPRSAVVVPEHPVALRDRHTVEHCRAHRPAGRWHPPWAERVRAEAVHGQPDLEQLRGVPVPPPDHDAGQPGQARLEQEQIADARLVLAAAVIDHQHGSRRRIVDRFEDHVDAAEVGHRLGRTRERPALEERHEAGGTLPDGQPEAEGRVGDGGGGDRHARHSCPAWHRSRWRHPQTSRMAFVSILRVVVAPDSFKGSLSATSVAEAIADGWHSVRPDDLVQLFPQADGGEGTLDAVEGAIPGAERRSAGTVTGPDGRPVPGEWLALPDGGAVVELAQMSGLPMMRVLDALGASTRGLGEVIAAAANSGANRIVLGIGGSASTDGGAGALAALGLRLLDADGAPVPHGGAALARVSAVDSGDLLPLPPVVVLTDVTNPLLGPMGAAAVFGSQKGADAAQVLELDAALANFARLLGGRPDAPGAGAAGGTGYGFATAYDAEIVSGADFLAALTGLDPAIAQADVVLSGEGRFDDQSLGGKVVGQLLAKAQDAGARFGVIAGQVTTGAGVWTASLTDLAGSVDAAIADPARWLRDAGAAAARELG